MSLTLILASMHACMHGYMLKAPIIDTYSEISIKRTPLWRTLFWLLYKEVIFPELEDFDCQLCIYALWVIFFAVNES